MKAAEDKSVAMASTTGFVKKEAPVKAREVTTANKVSVAELAGNKQAEPVADSKTTPSASPVGAGQGEETEEAAVVVPEVVVEDGQVTPPMVAAESADQDLTPGSGQYTLGVKKSDHRAKSRSGSPASVASPRAPILGPIMASPAHPKAEHRSTLGMPRMHTGKYNSLNSGCVLSGD